MSLSTELLHQARHLITKEPRRPRQASLRRGVSTAYYAMFHGLTDASAKFLVGGAAVGRRDLRHALRRSYVHGEMKVVSNAFAGGTPSRLWQQAAGPISVDLRRVAETFVELQDARHDADYDHARAWRRNEAIDLVQRAERALEAWARVQADRDATAYLVALLARSR